MSIDTHEEVRTHRNPALERLIRIMFVNMAIGLVAAACTWIFHGQILTRQLEGIDPTSTDFAALRDTMSTTLWSRPGPAAAIALLFPLFVRRLRAFRRPSYRRVMIIAVLQLLSIGWLTMGANYPWWLRAFYVVQAVAVLATITAATRPSVRTLFGYEKKSRPGSRAAAFFFTLCSPWRYRLR